MMLTQMPPPKRRLFVGGSALAMLSAITVATTLSASGAASASAPHQVVTICVKPDGGGSFALLVSGKAVALGTMLPGGATLPANFNVPAGCDLKPSAKAFAMVIKGSGSTRTYTVMCASARPASVQATLAEGLASLKTMRASVATQPASRVFPEPERTHTPGAIDRSISEVERTLSGKF